MSDPTLAAPDAPPQEGIIDKILDDWWDESPIGTALVLGYRDEIRQVMLKLALALTAASHSQEAGNTAIRESGPPLVYEGNSQGSILN